jgi:LysM repeat protein
MKTQFNSRRILNFAIIGAMLMAALAFVPPAAAQSPCGDTYVVQPGDWLVTIADQCDVTLNALLQANPQIENPSLIFPGQRLAIPSATIPDTGAQAQLQINPQSGVPGTTISVQGSNFPANVEVRVGPGVRGAEPVSMKTVNSDDEGNFNTTLTVPSNADPDQTWVVLAATQGGGVSLTREFNVVPRLEARNYVVKSGDTLFEIATRFDTTVQAMLRANPEIENPRLIFPGQELVLPGSLVVVPDTGRRVYVIQQSDTLGEIALRFGTTIETLQDANPGIEDPSLIFPGERLTIPVPVNVIPDTGRVVYTVQSGDSLSEIAVRFDTTVQALLDLNPSINDADLIFPGQRITIPRRSV